MSEEPLYIQINCVIYGFTSRMDKISPPETPNPAHRTLNPTPRILNPAPCTINRTPLIMNPTPRWRSTRRARRCTNLVTAEPGRFRPYTHQTSKPQSPNPTPRWRLTRRARRSTTRTAACSWPPPPWGAPSCQVCKTSQAGKVNRCWLQVLRLRDLVEVFLNARYPCMAASPWPPPPWGAPSWQVSLNP